MADGVAQAQKSTTRTGYVHITNCGAHCVFFVFFSCLLFNHLPGGFNTSTEMSDTQSLGYPAFDCSDLFPGSHLCDAERCLQGFLDLKITGKVLIRNLPSSAKRLKYILLNLES